MLFESAGSVKTVNIKAWPLMLLLICTYQGKLVHTHDSCKMSSNNKAPRQPNLVSFWSRCLWSNVSETENPELEAAETVVGLPWISYYLPRSRKVWIRGKADNAKTSNAEAKRGSFSADQFHVLQVYSKGHCFRT
jgi:hypothetical protein